jgi:hypothetical protein
VTTCASLLVAQGSRFAFAAAVLGSVRAGDGEVVAVAGTVGAVHRFDLRFSLCGSGCLSDLRQHFRANHREEVFLARPNLVDVDVVDTRSLVFTDTVEHD